MALTDLRIRNLKPIDKAFKVSDGGGLNLTVTPKGSKVEWLLGVADPAIGRRPIAEISSAEILEVLRSVEKRGRPAARD